MQLLKRIFNSLIIALFLLGAIGININKHYCKGRLAQVSLWQNDDPCAGEEHHGKAFKKMDCCSNEQISLEFEDDFQKENFKNLNVHVIQSKSFDLRSFVLPKVLRQNSQTDRAPPVSTVDIYLMQKKLIFYG